MGLFSKKEYKGTLRWEYLKNENGPSKSQRTKIPGGWLFYASDEFRTGGSGVTFIPDPEHKWNGNSK
ncbi:MAG: hypothetical protein OQJ81_11670 [Melioribacteraceae bacterium]|nr:hypothetical protein [Melioribacteraceae bacterium]